MKERPILFSGPMVRAILAGNKTQTRRSVKPQPQPNGGKGLHLVRPYQTPQGKWTWVSETTGHGDGTSGDFCPYGMAEDRLWVRETFSGNYCLSNIKPSMWGRKVGLELWYWADGQPDYGDWTRPKPSIHMPRFASRIILEIIEVRIERLQDCSESDGKAEGATVTVPYGTIWKKINTTPGIRWEDNPWVWVITFRRIEP